MVVGIVKVCLIDLGPVVLITLDFPMVSTTVTVNLVPVVNPAVTHVNHFHSDCSPNSELTNYSNRITVT